MDVLDANGDSDIFVIGLEEIIDLNASNIVKARFVTKTKEFILRTKILKSFIS